MDENLQDRIDQYILGRMSKEETSAFESELAEDAELREQYEFTKSVKEAVINRTPKMQLLQQWNEELKKEVIDQNRTTKACANSDTYMDAPKHTALKSRRLFWLSGIAAILVVGFFMVQTVVFNNPTSVPTPDGSASPEMRGDDDVFETSAPSSGKSVKAKDTTSIDSLSHKHLKDNR